MIIDRYGMQIYPRKLWVATGWGKELNAKFENFGGSELEDFTKSCAAATYYVTDKRTGCYGILIAFNNPEKMGGSEIVKNISHESVHAMTGVFKATGINPDNDNDEPMAYLTGWCAECCWKTLQKVVYKNKTKKSEKMKYKFVEVTGKDGLKTMSHCLSTVRLWMW